MIFTNVTHALLHTLSHSMPAIVQIQIIKAQFLFPILSQMLRQLGKSSQLT